MSLAQCMPPVWPLPGASAWGDDACGLWADILVGAVVQRLRWIEPGEFMMGSPQEEEARSEDEGPQHLVRLTRGYWLADTACTRALWRAVMGDDPSDIKDDWQQPVVQVSWERVQEFLKRVQGQLPAELEAVLPTEAQWEYACRAGTVGPFSVGANIDPSQVNYDGNYPYAGAAKGEYRKRTMAVKSLPPNGWGLYEMHGNVWEWCADGPRPYSAEPQEDPVGPQGGDRSVRGGSWSGGGRDCRSAGRGALQPGFAFQDLGFRLALRSKDRLAGAAERHPGGLAGEARLGPAEPGSANFSP